MKKLDKAQTREMGLEEDREGNYVFEIEVPKPIYYVIDAMQGVLNESGSEINVYMEDGNANSILLTKIVKFFYGTKYLGDDYGKLIIKINKGKK